MKREYWLKKYPETKILFDIVDTAKRVQFGPRPDRAFCRVAEWHGMIRRVGPIGLKPRFDALVRHYQMTPLEEDALRIFLMDQIPRCWLKKCNHRVDYYVAPISAEKQALIDAGKYLVWQRGVTTPEMFGGACGSLTTSVEDMVDEVFPEISR